MNDCNKLDVRHRQAFLGLHNVCGLARRLPKNGLPERRFNWL